MNENELFLTARIEALEKELDQMKTKILLESKAPEMLKFIQHVYNTMPNGSSLQTRAEQLIKKSTEL